MHKFEIFAGSRHNPLWLEASDGLNNAVARMKQRARSKPGIYFVFDSNKRTVVASIDTYISNTYWSEDGERNEGIL